MTLVASLALLLTFAFVLGRIAERLGQPALLGQMLAGIVLGPSLLGWVRATPALAAIADLAVLFVVVTAGLEMRMQHVLEAFRGSRGFALLLGFAVPAMSAGAFAWLIGLPLIPGLVATLCISVTALPVALRILGDFGLLDTRVARIAISGSLLSDVIVLLVLGVAIAMAAPNNDASLARTLTIAVAKLGLLLVVVAACHYTCQRLSAPGRGSPARQPSVETVLVLTLVFMLMLGAVAEALGFHFAIGVFMAALMVNRGLISDSSFESLERTCTLLTVSFFGPLFLAYQGVQFELGALGNAMLILGMIVVATASKLVGGYAAARLQQLPQYEAIGVAVIMNARGVMEMVVASIAYRAGLIDSQLFSALLIMGIATTVMTPMLLKIWMVSPKVATLVRGE